MSPAGDRHGQIRRDRALTLRMRRTRGRFAEQSDDRPAKAGDNARSLLAKAARRPIWLPMKFPPEFLDEIRARLPVSEVAGTRVKLRKEGREWRGLSPFSAEKTPSFFVNDQKGFFHDFSSGKHGDAFAFLMETEGLTFPEAVERLAGMAGLPMPRLSHAEAVQDKKRASLIDVMAMAARLFEANLQQPIGAQGARLSRRSRPWGPGAAALSGSATPRPSASRCATRSPPRASAPRR